MPIYLLDIGNSSNGPVGLCARIHAANEQEAVDRFTEVNCYSSESFNGIEYINTYINADHISVKDIQLHDSESCDKMPGACEFCKDNQDIDTNDE